MSLDQAPEPLDATPSAAFAELIIVARGAKRGSAISFGLRDWLEARLGIAHHCLEKRFEVRVGRDHLWRRSSG